MFNAEQTAMRIWNEIKSKNLGDVSAPAVIQREIVRAIENERNEIVTSIVEHQWSYNRIPWNMWTYSLYTLAVRPKQFFAAYYKCIQLKLAEKVRHRS